MQETSQSMSVQDVLQSSWKEWQELELKWQKTQNDAWMYFKQAYKINDSDALYHAAMQANKEKINQKMTEYEKETDFQVDREMIDDLVRFMSLIRLNQRMLKVEHETRVMKGERKTPYLENPQSQANPYFLHFNTKPMKV